MFADHCPVGAGTARPFADVFGEAVEFAGRAEHDTFVVELSGDEAPAAALLAHPHRHRNTDVVVVGGVDVVGAVGGDDRGPAETGIGGVDDQDGDALMLRGFFIGAAGQPDVVGVMAAGGKDLLPVDNIVIAVADRGGGERRQVGAGIGFGVSDGEMHLTGQDRGQEPLLLLVGAEGLQRRAYGL